MFDINLLTTAYRLMATARRMSELYEENRSICKFVHSTSKGHEAIQIATGIQLLNCDYVSPYYRDDSLMLSMGFEPYQLMLQLLAKEGDPFSGGRSYYCHPSSRSDQFPRIIHQSSATGMQAIPTTGIAQGIQFMENTHSALLRKGPGKENPVVICSLGDNSVTEGEVSEAWQFAVLKKLPIIYLVQDNNWGISVTGTEARAMDAYDYASGFPGFRKFSIDGTDFLESYLTMQEAIDYVRSERKPVVVHASVPLLGHHTSGVRKEFYRSAEDLEAEGKRDPYPKLRLVLLAHGFSREEISQIEVEAIKVAEDAFQRAQRAPDPPISSVSNHVFAKTNIVEEKGVRHPVHGEKVVMVDAAMHAIEEILQQHPEALLYGQDVGKRLGGVFREAATLGDKFGDLRVFNTGIQEAYIVGSTAGLSALGLRPIVEIQFADYVYPALNQLICEVAKSCYLTNGKYPVSVVIRIPIGAYGGGGPYHSGSIESTLLSIKGIKICYPSNAADMKGLMKAAFYDPNPVIMLEHKGLYWSKVPGTEDAKTIEPARDYILPIGKGIPVLKASDEQIYYGQTLCIITYGMGVYWAKSAAASFPGKVEIIDLRSLYPLDEALIFATVKRHGNCLVLTEEQQNNSFAEALASRISKHCFQYLDGPVEVMGALNLPAVPIQLALEEAMIPTVKKLTDKINYMLSR
ncbi:MAG: tungsten formylmethanofuran dehydrogenase [Bacteroidetes bacterium]|nr:tungsten formylmethanofuran dehydrogenase [Bacteroidota bacterium]